MKEEYEKGKISDVAVKEYLFESLMKTFAPARKRYEELKNNPQIVKKILADGASKARVIAVEMMKRVNDAIGVTNIYSISDKKQETCSMQDRIITIDEFARVEMRVGKVIEAVDVEKSEKLIRLVVDIAEEKPRVIFTGVRGYGYTPDDFKGKQFFFVVNLQYRKMMGEESQGMIIAVDGPEKPIFISADTLPTGARIR